MGPAAVPLNGAQGAAAAAARAGQCGRSCCEAESEADGVRRWAASPPPCPHSRKSRQFPKGHQLKSAPGSLHPPLMLQPLPDPPEKRRPLLNLSSPVIVPA